MKGITEINQERLVTASISQSPSQFSSTTDRCPFDVDLFDVNHRSERFRLGLHCYVPVPDVKMTSKTSNWCIKLDLSYCQKQCGFCPGKWWKSVNYRYWKSIWWILMKYSYYVHWVWDASFPGILSKSDEWFRISLPIYRHTYKSYRY